MYTAYCLSLKSCNKWHLCMHTFLSLLFPFAICLTAMSQVFSPMHSNMINKIIQIVHLPQTTQIEPCTDWMIKFFILLEISPAWLSSEEEWGRRKMVMPKFVHTREIRMVLCPPVWVSNFKEGVQWCPKCVVLQTHCIKIIGTHQFEVFHEWSVIYKKDIKRQYFVTNGQMSGHESDN